ncbi:MAG: hypothetical protein JOZ39_04040 [Chloroflexi bacterium]|nr:hypothetical protein [Chloroflexota bacterium]
MALLALATTVSPALAQTGGPAGPARTANVIALPYNVVAEFYANPVRTGEAVTVTLRQQAGSAALLGASVTMTAIPAAGTDATSTRPLAMPADGQDAVSGRLSLATAGEWTLRFDISGPAGSVSASTPLTVTGPPAIPVWLGWLVGLSPGIAGLVAFGVWCGRYLAKLKAEEGIPAS